MAIKSAEADSFFVAQAPHGVASSTHIPAQRDFLESLVRHLKANTVYKSDAAIYNEAGIDGPDFYAALNSGSHLPAPALQSIVHLLPDPSERQNWSRDADVVELAHRARWRGTLAQIHRLSPGKLYYRRAEAAGLSDPKDHWYLLFCRLSHGLGLPIVPLERLDIRWALETMVDRTRHEVGEKAALRHAIILFQAVITSRPITPQNAATLLELAYQVIGLAAQVNDVAVGGDVTTFVAGELRSHLREGIERIACDRVVNSSRATLSRQKRSGFDKSDTALARDELVARSLENWKQESQETGFARDHPRVGLTLTSGWFQRISSLMGRKASPEQIVDAVKTHDEVGFALDLGDAPPLSLGNALASSGFTAIHWSDLQADFLLYETDGAERGPNDIRCCFDPGAAIDICQTALKAFSPEEHYADTAFASVRLTLAKALLLKEGNARFTRWPANRRSAYVRARSEAERAFSGLAMDWKLRPLGGLEAKYGFVAEEWGVKRLGFARGSLRQG